MISELVICIICIICIISFEFLPVNIYITQKIQRENYEVCRSIRFPQVKVYVCSLTQYCDHLPDRPLGQLLPRGHAHLRLQAGGGKPNYNRNTTVNIQYVSKVPTSPPVYRTLAEISELLKYTVFVPALCSCPDQKN